MKLMKLMKRKTIVFLTALAVCAAILLSLCFVAAEADHDCQGENCPVCLAIGACAAVLSAAVLSAAALLSKAPAERLPRVMRFPAQGSAFYDLITLKVKLSN